MLLYYVGHGYLYSSFNGSITVKIRTIETKKPSASDLLAC